MLPDLGDVLASLRVVELPLVTTFRGLSSRQVALFEGPLGWVEFSPFVEYGDDESATWLSAAVDFGWIQPPTPRRSQIPVNATVPAVSPDEVPEVLAAFPGCRTAKVKVAQPGQQLADDLARVRRVREVMGDDALIRVDANGAWSLDKAERACVELQQFGLDYVEQPCASIADLAALRQRVSHLGIRIAADESIRKLGDPRAVVEARACDVVILKAAPLGGIHSALRIADELGVRAVISSALETSIGLSMGAYLAAAMPRIDDAGLGTAALLAADVTRDPLLPHDGHIDVRRIVPHADLLDRFAVDEQTCTWWRERIVRCHAILHERSAETRG